MNTTHTAHVSTSPHISVSSHTWWYDWWLQCRVSIVSVSAGLIRFFGFIRDCARCILLLVSIAAVAVVVRAEQSGCWVGCNIVLHWNWNCEHGWLKIFGIFFISFESFKNATKKSRPKNFPVSLRVYNGLTILISYFSDFLCLVLVNYFFLFFHYG